VEEMELVNTLCWLADYARGSGRGLSRGNERTER
jgi:hypothetical protein